MELKALYEHGWSYRAKTKGKVERVVREVKESFLAWLTGQILTRHPSISTDRSPREGRLMSAEARYGRAILATEDPTGAVRIWILCGSSLEQHRSSRWGRHRP